MEKVEAKQICHHHMHRYVRVVILDGRTFDGFIENVDDEHLYLAVPVGHEMHHEPMHHEPMHHEHMEHAGYHENNAAPVGSYGHQPQLQPISHGPQQGYGSQQGCGCGGQSWGSGGYPGVDARGFFPGYYPGSGFGYNPYGRRRFNRAVLPLALLTTLTLLPFF
ncbi:hypothetical protein ACP8HI_14180 [Paenibacillus sp. FA6]|uniref:hypothetical protein n=1 Tax=Paenibacillus sp. FA6 TaxID=3413029 RepID=UPI003F65E0F0